MDGATDSFFEGPEKKVELVVTGGIDLREVPRARWEAIVAAANASVLSVRSSPFFDAYLLSESSLFVYPDHVTMITCGRTRLVDAILALLDTVGVENVALLVYERKNEHFPSLQHTTFKADAARLGQVIAGEAWRFGAEHAHCIEVFVCGTSFVPDPCDVTLEVLMHGLDARAAAAFAGPTSERTAARIGLDRLLPGFEIDEHAFSPAGYSLNALSGEHYFTIHVTPENEGSYASFETNWDFRSDPDALIRRVTETFSPESFDVLAFVPGAEPLALGGAGYQERKHVRSTLAGYGVTYASFFRSPRIEQPVALSLVPPARDS